MFSKFTNAVKDKVNKKKNAENDVLNQSDINPYTQDDDNLSARGSQMSDSKR